MSRPEIWEYKIERTTSEYTPNIDALGREGWELVSVATIQNREWQDYKYFFKRRLKTKI